MSAQPVTANTTPRPAAPSRQHLPERLVRPAGEPLMPPRSDELLSLSRVWAPLSSGTPFAAPCALPTRVAEEHGVLSPLFSDANKGFVLRRQRRQSGHSEERTQRRPSLGRHCLNPGQQDPAQAAGQR